MTTIKVVGGEESKILSFTKGRKPQKIATSNKNSTSGREDRAETNTDPEPDQRLSEESGTKRNQTSTLESL